MPVSLRNLIDTARRMDELGIARVIANAAELVHKQQKGGQPLNTLTPDAIVVASDGEVTLSLGAARPAYSSPERLRDEPGDRRSDVFALGAILWEALAHEQLFEGSFDAEIKASVLTSDYRSATELNANVPAELDAICKKALARTPADRYPSCKVMAAEIATVLDDAGYPDDNSQIAEYLATKYVPPEPKPAPSPSRAETPVPMRETPLPASITPAAPSLATTAPTATLQGVAPRKEIDAALAKAAAEKDAPIELTNKIEPIELTEKKVDPKQTLIASPELKKPAEPERAKTPSSQPVAERAKTPSSQPVAERAKTPSSQPLSSLPSWATARSATPSSPPDATLPGMPTMLNTPPVGNATQPDPAPKSFAKTQVLGSMSGADIALPPVEPTAASSAPPGKKTEVHGSASLADRLAAINAAAAPAAAPVPGLPAVPPGADPGAAVAAEPILPSKPIATAETVPTPALAGYAAAEAKAAAALAAVTEARVDVPKAPADAATLVPKPPVLPEAKSVPPSEAVAMAAQATGTAVAADESAVHPASVVSLPRPRSKSEGGAVRDPLAGWGWGTGPHDAIQGHDDDDFYDHQRSSKRRLVLAIGGAAGAVLLVVVAAFAFGGGSKHDSKKADVAAKQAEPAVDWSQPTERPAPPAPDPNAGSAVDPNAGSAVAVDPNAGSAAVGSAALDPNAGSAVAVDPNAGSNGSAGSGAGAGSALAVEAPKPAPPTTEPPKTEPPKTEPVVKTEPPKTEPPKTEPPKTEPPKTEPKVAKTEPPKTEPPKTEPKVAKTEPKVAKTEPPKIDKKKTEPKVAKAEPKTASWDPLAPKVKADPKKPKPAPGPIDPYAEKKPAADPSAAYKTGIQQFAHGDSTAALSTFKASLAANPDFAPTWRGIGMVYEKLGRKAQAKTAFKRYLQLSPSAGDAEQIRERMERL